MITNYSKELHKLDLITEQAEFDFTSFWETGGFAFKFNRDDLLKRMGMQIDQNETFIKETHCANPAELASWETDWRTRETPPVIYTDIGQALVESPLIKSYTDIYGDFTFTKYMLHKTPRDYINRYHSHMYDGNHMIVLMYYCPVPRNFSDGGLIELGEVYNKLDVRFDTKGFFQTDDTQVIPMQSYVPETGLAICMNNLNPFFRHGVTRVLTDNPRYTLQIGFGYKDNCTLSEEILHI